MFTNPNHLSGKQLENFNKTQNALQNITNSQQNQQFTHNQFGTQIGTKPQQQQQQQKQVSFGGEANSKFSSIPQSHEVSFISNNQQNDPFFGGGKPNQPANAHSKTQFNSDFNSNANPNTQQNNQLNFKQKNGESITDLVQQSNETLRQLEDQFKSLGFTKGNNQINKPHNQDQNGPLSFNNKGPINSDSSNIKSIISDVDKIIQQAQQQTKQLTSNNDGGFNLQGGYNSKLFEERGRGFPNANRGISSSPSKKKQNSNKKRNKSKNNKRRGKHNRRREQSSSGDDTSSYSGQSDSIIQEQDDESHFEDSSNDENYNEDEDDNYNRSRNKRSKLKNKKKFSNDYESKRSNNKKGIHDAKSISNVSRARSNQSRNNQQTQGGGLKQSQLKNLPGMCGGTKNEPSVYSSASKMKIQHSQISHQNQMGGFRRCPDESEDNINVHKNTDDSFDINEDFNIIGGVSGKMSSQKKNRNTNNDNYNFKKKVYNDNNDYDGDIRRNRRGDEQENQDEQYLMQRYQSQKEVSVVSNLQSRIQMQKQQIQQMQLAADEDLIFCINCEEYIKADKVDEHSNICEASKEDTRYLNSNQVMQKINEKLIKIRYLVKNKNSHIVNQPIQNNQQQSLIVLYEQILDILSICIENNTDIHTLQEAEADIKNINTQLFRNNHSSSHYLLYLTQKVIEFVQRKYEFLQRYGSGQDNFDNYNTHQQFRTNQNLQQRDLNNFSNNLDAISIASSTFNKQNNQNNNNNFYQSNQRVNTGNKIRDPIKIFNKIEEDMQFLNPNQNTYQQQSLLRNPGLPPRQPGAQVPVQTNLRSNNIFAQEQSPLKQLQQNQPQSFNSRDIFQSPSTNYSPQAYQVSPGQQQKQQNYNRNSGPNLQQQETQQNFRLGNNSSVSPFQIAPKQEQQLNQQNQHPYGTIVNSIPFMNEEQPNVNQQARAKKNIFSENQQSPPIPIQGRQFTNQSEKSQDNFEYQYKNLTARPQNQNHQLFQNLPNNNQNQGYQTVTVRESQIPKSQNQSNQYNYQNTNMNSNINIQAQYNQDQVSPYKVQSPYKVTAVNEDSNFNGVQKQKFFLLANSLKQKYPQSQLFLIADLWKEACQLQLQERDWDRFIIQKFQS